MRVIAGLVVAVVLCGALAGCAGFYAAPVVPPVASIYTDVKAPIDIDAASSPVTGKVGKATVQNVLGLVAWGDASIKAAAADGGISKVEHVDYEFFNILGVYAKFTTMAYGQ